MAIKRVPPEVLERIFSHVIQYRDVYSTGIGFTWPEHLHACSLVCRAWRGPAQLLLHSTVRLCNIEDLKHFHERLAHTSSIGTVFRILSIRLHDNGRSEPNRLHALHLRDIWHYFRASLRELWINTRSTHDDPLLARLIGECQMLRTLQVQHSSLPERHEADPTYSEEEYDVDTEDPDDSETFCTFPSLFSLGIALLPNLRHLCFMRLHFHSLGVHNLGAWPCRLYSLSIILTWLDDMTLDWLVGGRQQHLRFLSLVNLEGVTKERIAKLFDHSMPALGYLSFAAPWRGIDKFGLSKYGSDIGGTLKVNDCPELKVLRCHDKEVDYISIMKQGSVFDLILTVDTHDRIDRLLEQTIHPPNRALQYQVWQPRDSAIPALEVRNKWMARGVLIEYLSYDYAQNALIEFRTGF